MLECALRSIVTGNMRKRAAQACKMAQQRLTVQTRTNARGSVSMSQQQLETKGNVRVVVEGRDWTRMCAQSIEMASSVR